MENNLFIFIIVWLTVWAVVWIPAFMLFKREMTYINRWIFFSCYFAIASVLSYFVFKTNLSLIFQYDSNFPWGIIIVGYGIILCSYALAPHFFKRPTELIKKSPSEYFIYLDFRTVLPKTTEIIFQQLLIIALTLRLSQEGYSVGGIIVAFAIFFGVVHMGMFKTDPKFWAWFFTISAVISAFIFPVLILKFEYGFVYSFLIHLLFYIPTGVLFWIWQPKI